MVADNVNRMIEGVETAGAIAGRFCAASDRHGYIAAHNRNYSQRQRPGDPARNAANARNRRVFDDPAAAILAARCSKPGKQGGADRIRRPHRHQRQAMGSRAYRMH